MQNSQIFQFRQEHKNNILFQVGHCDGITLSSLLESNEHEILRGIPYWLIIPRLPAPQLTILANKQRIVIPRTCTKTRDSLVKVVLKAYEKWYAVLDNNKTSLHDLLKTFKHLDFCFKVETGKNEIKEKIRPIKPGDEIMIL